jgi:hypothetical protein
LFCDHCCMSFVPSSFIGNESWGNTHWTWKILNLDLGSVFTQYQSVYTWYTLNTVLIRNSGTESNIAILPHLYRQSSWKRLFWRYWTCAFYLDSCGLLTCRIWSKIRN